MDCLVKDYDEIAWQHIRNWPSAIEFDPVCQHLDFWALTQSFLRDKVGRALRFKLCDVSVAMEREMLLAEGWTIDDLSPLRPVRFVDTLSQERTLNFKSWGALLQQYLSTRKWQLRVRARQIFRHYRENAKRVIFIPYLGRPLLSVGERLAADIRNVIVSKENRENISSVIPFVKFSGERTFPVESRSLANAIIAGLSARGIDLLQGDIKVLNKEIDDLMTLLATVEEELVRLAPSLVIVHADNHPPHQVYVAISRTLGIPCVMLQHGLDCERFVLDEAFAGEIAVWGQERARRYNERSVHKAHLHVVGCPEYDGLRLPEKIEKSGDYWLWMTRPHGPQKCYGVSHTVDEGGRIMTALLKVLSTLRQEKLVIKVHPYDCRDIYEKLIAQSECRDRVMFSSGTSLEVVRNAKLVITEDSTAGMEAMFYGKPIVHSHFGGAPPTLPFVSWGCAHQAFSELELEQVLRQMVESELSVSPDRLEAYRKFLLAFAGPCDGSSSRRFEKLVETLVA